MRTSNDDPLNGRLNDAARTASPRPAVAYRAASARPVAAVIWILAAGTLGWLLTAGDARALVHATPWLCLVSWVVYASQWRPCLRVDGAGYDVVNGLREHRIPFGLVEDVEVRYTTTIRAAGKKYVSWGAPNPPSAFGSGFQHAGDLKSHPFSILPGNERLSQPETRTGRDAIAAAWRDAQAAGTATRGSGVVTTWSAPTIVAGAAAVLAVTLATFS